jgi:opacity protein-like surface antigen
MSLGSDLFTFSGGLNNSIDERSNADLVFSRSTTVTREGEVFENWQISSGYNRIILEDFAASLSGFYGEGKFGSGIEDKFTGLSGSLSYAVTEHISADAGYSISDLDSSDKSRDYTRNTISAGLTITF